MRWNKSISEKPFYCFFSHKMGFSLSPIKSKSSEKNNIFLWIFCAQGFDVNFTCMFFATLWHPFMVSLWHVTGFNYFSILAKVKSANLTVFSLPCDLQTVWESLRQLTKWSSLMKTCFKLSSCCLKLQRKFSSVHKQYSRFSIFW